MSTPLLNEFLYLASIYKMQTKNYILYPNNISLREHAIAFEECIEENVEKIFFESPIKFKNSQLSLTKVLDIFNIQKIYYILKKLKYTTDNDINIFVFAPELNYVILFVYVRLFLKNVKIWYLMHEPNAIDRKVLKGYMVHFYNLFVLKFSHKIILASRHGHEMAKKTFGNNPKMIFINLVFSSKGDFIKNSQSEQEQIFSENTFLYYGTSSYGKRPDRVNLIAEKLLSFENDISYQIIRAGRDKDIINYMSNVEVIAKYLTKDEINKLLKKAKYIVLPYDFIVQSGIIVEALSYGKLIIASNITGFNQYSNCEAVFLINFENEEQIHNQLTYLLGMTFDEYHRKVEFARQYFNDNHSYSYLRNELKQYLK